MRPTIPEPVSQNEALYRTLFECIDQGFCLVELLDNEAGKAVDYRFLEVNAVFERQTGFAGAKGKRATELAPNLNQAWIDTVDSVARTGQPLRTEAFFDDPARWYAIAMSRLGDASSRLVVSVFDDITQHKQQERQRELLDQINLALLQLETIEQTLERLGELVGRFFQVPWCILAELVAQPEGTLAVVTTGWNQAGFPSLKGTYRMEAYLSAQQLAKHNAGEVSVVADTQTDPAVDGPNYGALGIRAFINVPLARQGRWQFQLAVLSDQIRPWSSLDVDFLAIITQHIWIRLERVRAENSLVLSEEKYRTLFETMGEGIAVIDILRDANHYATDVRIVDVNQALERQTGLQRDQLVGKTLFEVFPLTDAERWMAVWRRVADTGQPMIVEEYVELVDRWFETSAYAQGPNRVIYFYRDISQRKRMEAALQSADQRKDEFLALLAHELRNPLAPICNGLQLIGQTHQTDPLLGTILPVMNRQMDHLMRLVDDLLDVSRISRGKIELRQDRLDLTQVVAQATEAMRPLYANAERVLTTQLPQYALTLVGDATRLNQVVTNLLTNGLRYTQPGGQVWVRLEQLGAQAVLRVADNGIGIAANQLDAIFGLFVQADHSLARSHGGLGLGLSLVRELVDRHGGRVEARSQGLGQGSEFVLYLPLLLA